MFLHVEIKSTPFSYVLFVHALNILMSTLRVNTAAIQSCISRYLNGSV